MTSLKSVAARIGPLTCRIVDVDPSSTPTLVCVLCHGYGAPGTDLVGIAGEVLSVAAHLVESERFVFPEAPLSLDNVPFGGRAWWQIDVGRFSEAVVTGEYEALFREVPEGLPAARKALVGTLDEMTRQFGIPMSKVVLGGFSQGAMITTDIALRSEEAPAALAILSGTLIAQEDWKRLAPKRTALPVLQSHGMNDPILPYPAAIELRSLLENAGLNVNFVSFRGGHGIDHPVLVALAKLLEAAFPQTTNA